MTIGRAFYGETCSIAEMALSLHMNLTGGADHIRPEEGAQIRAWLQDRLDTWTPSPHVNRREAVDDAVKALIVAVCDEYDHESSSWFHPKPKSDGALDRLKHDLYQSGDEDCINRCCNGEMAEPSRDEQCDESLPPKEQARWWLHNSPMWHHTMLWYLSHYKTKQEAAEEMADWLICEQGMGHLFGGVSVASIRYAMNGVDKPTCPPKNREQVDWYGW